MKKLPIVLWTTTVCSSLNHANACKYNAFIMLASEEAIPPYEPIHEDELDSLEVTLFNELGPDGSVIGSGALAFTLPDIFYTDDLLFCDEENCCEAQNYSYEGSSIEYPPCSTNEAVIQLSQNCSLNISKTPHPQQLPSNVASSFCRYYTLYNQSGLSKNLSDCVSDFFYDQWSDYCTETDNGELTFVYSLLPMALTYALGIAIIRQKRHLLKNKVQLQVWLQYFLLLVPAFDESLILTYITQGLVYKLKNILFSREYHLQYFNAFPIVEISCIAYGLIRGLVIGLLGNKDKTTAFFIKANAKGSDLINFTYSLLKAISMFCLSMEFFETPYSSSENTTLALSLSSFMAFISFIKGLNGINIINEALSYCTRSKKNPFKDDFIFNTYPHIHLLLNSLLLPVVLDTFLQTFSSMTVIIGTTVSEQTWSFFSIALLSYSLNILAESHHDFELLFEAVFTFFESWAFLYATYLGQATDQTDIKTCIYYYFSSTRPILFTTLSSPVLVLYVFFLQSTKRFIPLIMEKTNEKTLAARRKLDQAVSDETHLPNAEEITRFREAFSRFIQAPDSASLLLTKKTDETKQEDPLKLATNSLSSFDLYSIFLDSLSGGHYLYKLIEFFSPRNRLAPTLAPAHEEIDTRHSPSASTTRVSFTQTKSESHSSHKDLVRHPTTAFIGIALLAGSSLYLFNLSEAISSLNTCRQSLTSIVNPNCSTECLSLFPDKAPIKGVGSSWFALALFFSAFIAWAKLSSLPQLISCNKPRQTWCNKLSPYATSIACLAISLPSLIFSTIILRVWLRTFDEMTFSSLNCSNHAPFSATKRQLHSSGGLSAALSAVMMLPIIFQAVAHLIRKYKCKSTQTSLTTSPTNNNRSDLFAQSDLSEVKTMLSSIDIEEVQRRNRGFISCDHPATEALLSGEQNQEMRARIN